MSTPEVLPLLHSFAQPRRPRALLDLDRVVEEQLQDLRPGTMAVDVVTEMQAFRPYPLVVSIGTIDKAAVIAAIGKSLGTVVTADIQVGRFMRVEVSGDAFTVKPSGSTDLLVRDDKATIWHFRVTPTATGQQTLTIQATIRVRLPNTDAQEYCPLDEQRQEIQVRVNVVGWLWHFLTNKTVLFALSTVVGLIGTILGYVFGLDAVKQKVSDLIGPWLTALWHFIFGR
jgi:hypothetical protein